VSRKLRTNFSEWWTNKNVWGNCFWNAWWSGGLFYKESG
jgi:hypothetical protein